MKIDYLQSIRKHVVNSYIENVKAQVLRLK
ncbi:hypothetical protein BN1195_01136 [Chryseobacterium oranimense G311]|nr:hypothetical protein BN1195_01136 [Chryseobacterium oranimense G311]